MSDLRTAAQQALEALAIFATDEIPEGWQAISAITALRAALAKPDYWQEEARRYASNADYWRKRFETLAEPVQEPVAWRTFDGEGGWDYRDYENNEDYIYQYVKRNGGKYAHWVEPLYTAPPQRKPLTDEEIRDLWSWAMTAEAERTATTQQHAFARAIERAHGIGGGND